MKRNEFSVFCHDTLPWLISFSLGINDRTTGENMRTLTRYLGIVILSLAFLLPADCSRSPAGKYTSQKNPNDYIELRSDGTFFIKETHTYGGAVQKTGKYRVEGKTMTLELGSSDAARGTIDGDTLIDPAGDKWIRK